MVLDGRRPGSTPATVLGFKVGLSLLFGLVPAALIALFWTAARVAALAALPFASPEPGQKLLRA